jgi:hypothetical protein
MATQKQGKNRSGGQKKTGGSAAQRRPASKKSVAPDDRRAAPPSRRMMPVPLQNVLIGLIIFTLTLGVAIIFQYAVCALALGIAVYQLWNHRARWLWTWMCLIAVGLYVVGVYLALHYQFAWFLYFGAWILVIVAAVGEGSRAFRRPRRAPDEPDVT